MATQINYSNLRPLPTDYVLQDSDLIAIQTYGSQEPQIISWGRFKNLFGSGGTPSFANITGNPTDNAALATALANAGTGLPSQTGNASKIITTNGTNPSWVFPNTDYYNVKNYGAKGDGTTNDQPYIQALINLLQTQGFGVVYFPSGIYKIDSGLTCNQRDIKFIGASRSQILSTFTTGDILFVGPTTAPPNDGTQDLGIQGLEIKNLDFQSSVKRTSGAAIHVQYSEHAVIENIRIGKLITVGSGPFLANIGTAKHYDGIFMEYSAAPTLSKLQVYMSHTGIKICGNLAGGFWSYFNYDGHIHGNWQIWGDRSAGSTGIHIGGGLGGLRIEDGNMVWIETGVKVDKTLFNSINRELFFGHFFVDSCDGHGYDIKANSVNILKFDNCWIAGMGRGTQGLTGYPYGAGINVETQDASFKGLIDGIHLYSVSGTGVQTSGGAWTITGSNIYQVGMGTNGGDGIACLSSSQNNINISSNTITEIGNSTRGYGINLEETISNFVISANIVNTCMQGPYSGPVSGTINKVTKANSGIEDSEPLPTSYPIIESFIGPDVFDILNRTVGSSLWKKTSTGGALGSIGIVSQQAKSGYDLSFQKYYFNAAKTAVDVKYTIGVAGTNIYGLLAFDDDNNYLQCDLQTGEVKQLVAGTPTTLVAGSGLSVAGNILRFNFDGSSVTAYRGATVLGSGAVDPSLISMNVGIFFYQDGVGTIDKIQVD